MPTEDDNEFVSVASLLVKGLSVGVVATAIEEGTYTWDRYGRSIEASDADPSDKTSKIYALDRLAEYYHAIEKNSLSPPDVGEIENGTEMLLVDYGNPLWSFGWEAESCPDFGTLQAKYDSENIPKPKNQIVDPSKQAHVYRLLRAFVAMYYGQDKPERLLGDYGEEVKEIITDLETLNKKDPEYNYDFTEDRLKRYLYDLLPE